MARALTGAQEAQLLIIANADNAWRKAKQDAHIRARVLVDDEIAAYAHTRAATVRTGLDMGLSRAKMGSFGLHTSSPNAVAECLGKTAGPAAAMAAMAPAHPLASKVSWDPVERFFTLTADDGSTGEYSEELKERIYELPSGDWAHPSLPVRIMVRDNENIKIYMKELI